MIKYTGILGGLFLCLSIVIHGQDTDIVKTEGIKTSIQRNNIGKIFFTNKHIEISELNNSDFLKSYVFTNKSNLFFVAFFDNSLTNYLHYLSPDLSSDSLNKIGNYQFTLFVDGEQIYLSNLLPGAPYAKIQDTATMLNRSFIDNENGTGSWSESFWNRFMQFGGDSILTDGNHTLKMEIRPYIKIEGIKIGKLIASGEIPIQVNRHPKIDISKIQLNKVTPYNGFEVSEEQFDINKIKELIGNINEGLLKKINSVIVIMNGKLLIEEYFNGEDRYTLHDPRSVGKSFTSSLIGIAVQDGYITNENQKLKDFYNLKSFKNFSVEKENISIKELLTMSSGFNGNDEDWSSPGNEENMYPTPNWVKFALDLSWQDSLADRWHYFTAGVILLGDILNKSVEGGLENYADKKLFKHLGITNYKWEYTPQHVPNTAGGIRMNALDFAKYGQMYKNGGKWNNKQIIEEKWIDKTFSKQKQITGRQNEFYGYLFWNKSFQVNNKSYAAYYCAGNGGNYILVFKDMPLVVVITAAAYGQSYAHRQVVKMLTDYILPAVIK
jgi:CubicO group peptidase (beta-lactamase class C family)